MPAGVRQDLLEHLAHLERVPVALVVVDVAAGERRLVEVPGQDLLIQRQTRRSRPRSTAPPRRRRLARAGTASFIRVRSSPDGPASSRSTPSSRSMRALSASIGPGSPWTRQVSAGGRREAAEPAHDFVAIGVRGHRVDRLDLARATGTSCAVDARELRAVLELAPARAGRLIAGKQHGVARDPAARARDGAARGRRSPCRSPK